MTADIIPDIVLERYRLNELPPAETARIAERLGVDVPLRQRLEALDRSDESLREPIDRLRSRPTGPTIIYVTLQRTAEELAAKLVIDDLGHADREMRILEETVHQSYDWLAVV